MAQSPAKRQIPIGVVGTIEAQRAALNKPYAPPWGTPVSRLAFPWPAVCRTLLNSVLFCWLKTFFFVAEEIIKKTCFFPFRVVLSLIQLGVPKVKKKNNRKFWRKTSILRPFWHFLGYFSPWCCPFSGVFTITLPVFVLLLFGGFNSKLSKIMQEKAKNIYKYFQKCMKLCTSVRKYAKNGQK